MTTNSLFLDELRAEMPGTRTAISTLFISLLRTEYTRTRLANAALEQDRLPAKPVSLA